MHKLFSNKVLNPILCVSASAVTLLKSHATEFSVRGCGNTWISVILGTRLLADFPLARKCKSIHRGRSKLFSCTSQRFSFCEKLQRMALNYSQRQEQKSRSKWQYNGESSGSVTEALLNVSSHFRRKGGQGKQRKLTNDIKLRNQDVTRLHINLQLILPKLQSILETARCKMASYDCATACKTCLFQFWGQDPHLNGRGIQINHININLNILISGCFP